MSLDSFLGINNGQGKKRKEVRLEWRRKPANEQQNGCCIFLRNTFYGTRCVLMSPEDWKRLRSNGNNLPCWRGGRGCNLKIKVLSLRWKRWQVRPSS